MLQKIKRLFRRKKAVSPVLATILLIAITVAAVAIVYFVVAPYFSNSQFYAYIYKIRDSNKDSQYDEITLFVDNVGTKSVQIQQVIVWTTPKGLRYSDIFWERHEGWDFESISDKILNPNEMKQSIITSDEQITLTVSEDTYYRLEITVSGRSNPYISDWELINDKADFADLSGDFRQFDLQAWGFEGTIDVPNWPNNNYNTTGGPLFGPLIPGQTAYLPVINETRYIPFEISQKMVVFHSVSNGNLTEQSLIQQVNRTSDPFRARKLFVLGLAGSWGDEFPTNSWALKLNITYTDGSSSIWLLGHEYIDDWWYTSNPGGDCISAPSGLITEIDLGTQINSPKKRIHTHTAGFYLDFYKYIQYITFEDPGTDDSGPHLLSLTAG
jgi:flagellin-like protein